MQFGIVEKLDPKLRAEHTNTRQGKVGEPLAMSCARIIIVCNSKLPGNVLRSRQQEENWGPRSVDDSCSSASRWTIQARRKRCGTQHVTTCGGISKLLKKASPYAYVWRFVRFAGRNGPKNTGRDTDDSAYRSHCNVGDIELWGVPAA
eukprot:2049625-Amphidinium_carterae.1